jgi:hypothetical protein
MNAEYFNHSWPHTGFTKLVVRLQAEREGMLDVVVDNYNPSSLGGRGRRIKV